ncbi:hypothetical protein [Streptomyces sp. NPDC013171]|uniref:hypothetical protein n=1 Tax=Streptomyces sp. NPDC013171 TaxID=3364863 RepID=UPI0036B6C86A
MPLKLMFLVLRPMNTASGSFDAVPLEALFPDASVADLGRLRRSADEIDDVQVSGKPQVWEWFPQHVTFPGRAKASTPEILLAVVSLYDEGTDWLELSLDVEWTKGGPSPCLVSHQRGLLVRGGP